MRQELLAKKDVEIRGMFGRIAPRYDLLNRVLSLGRDVSWRRTVARRGTAAGGSRVLDVCTGTGDLALAFPDGVAIGADFCLPMLEMAQIKARTRGRSLPLVAADSLQLPFADGCVDLITVAFGVRNFEDLAAGLDELVRVLRPGGTLLVLEFSRPRGSLAPILGWWVRTIPPRVGRLLSGDDEAYAYLPASVRAFPDADLMCEKLTDAGLHSARATALTGGVATLYEGTVPERRGNPSNVEG